jgi:two-component system nitrogen regulation response regulator GlnG/two-component system response regulator HydG
VGEVATLGNNLAVLGRGDGDGSSARIDFVRQRPGKIDHKGPLESPRLSRDQLELNVIDADRVHVRNVGRCTLQVNGIPVVEADVGQGDVLTLQNEAVLLIESRVSLWQPLATQAWSSFDFGAPDDCGLVGESPALWELREQIADVAASASHVLVHGPSGAGKELVGRAIHLLSGRAGHPLVARNAATLPESLLDAELFGNTKNYPNVGSPERHGLIGQANGGTLMLDEIGEMPATLQTHLLRVLDAAGEYQALGDSTPRRSDLRVVALTNRDPAELKHDFLARFQTRISVPKLADRLSDLPLLMRAAWQRLAEEQPSLLTKFDRGTPDSMSWEPLMEPALVELLVRHSFQDNFRELERILRVVARTSAGSYAAVSPELRAEVSTPGVESNTVDRAAIVEALAETGNNRSLAAQRLGLKDRHVLYRLMKKFDV